MRLPNGLHTVRGAGGVEAFATPEVEGWVRRAIESGEALLDAAARHAETVLRGRGAVPVLVTARGRWVVRRYLRGGMVAAPLLGDRHLRVGGSRPVREAHASTEALRRGIPTPRVVGGAVYPSGPFYRADLMTEYVSDAADLAQILFEEERTRRERADVLREVGRLVGRAAAAGIEHADLNARNVLVERPRGGAVPLFLDLDRCRILPAGKRADPARMLERLERSLRKLAAQGTRTLDREEWAILRTSALAGNEG